MWRESIEGEDGGSVFICVQENCLRDNYRSQNTDIIEVNDKNMTITINKVHTNTQVVYINTAVKIDIDLYRDCLQNPKALIHFLTYTPDTLQKEDAKQLFKEARKKRKYRICEFLEEKYGNLSDDDNDDSVLDPLLQEAWDATEVYLKKPETCTVERNGETFLGLFNSVLQEGSESLTMSHRVRELNFGICELESKLCELDSQMCELNHANNNSNESVKTSRRKQCSKRPVLKLNFRHNRKRQNFANSSTSSSACSTLQRPPRKQRMRPRPTESSSRQNLSPEISSLLLDQEDKDNIGRPILPPAPIPLGLPPAAGFE